MNLRNNNITEDMLDDLYDCLALLNNIREFDELKIEDSIILTKAYNVLEELYNRYTV